MIFEPQKFQKLSLETERVLSDPARVTDEEAAVALREFFGAVADIDGVDEVRRLYECFYVQLHHAYPVGKPNLVAGPGSSEGGLGVKLPAKAAKNGV